MFDLVNLSGYCLLFRTELEEACLIFGGHFLFVVDLKFSWLKWVLFALWIACFWRGYFQVCDLLCCIYILINRVDCVCF